jgi:hypothetical protein
VLIFLIILAVFALLVTLALSLRIRITVEYKDELKVTLRALCFKRQLIPKEKRGPKYMSRARAKRIKERLKKKHRRRKSQISSTKKEISAQSKESFGSMLDVISAIKDIIFTLLSKFFSHLRVDVAKFHINIATGDAASTAITYGAVCDALLHLFAILEPLKGFELPKTRDISVNADYLSERTTADIKISFSLRVWQIIHIILATFIKMVLHNLWQMEKTNSLPKGHKNKAA